jgi:hypothetical protein
MRRFRVSVHGTLLPALWITCYQHVSRASVRHSFSRVTAAVTQDSARMRQVGFRHVVDVTLIIVTCDQRYAAVASVLYTACDPGGRPEHYL